MNAIKTTMTILVAAAAGCATSNTAPLTNESASAGHVPGAALVVVHQVEDFDRWKAGFDAHGDVRKDAGFVAHHVSRGADDGNQVMVYLAANSQDEIQAFISNPELKTAMQDAGVVGQPMMKFMTPREDMTVKQQNLAGAVIMHTVADYGTWKAAFDEHDAARKEAGIVGHAVNTDAQDDTKVVVYLQAADVATLQGFMGQAELKDAMMKAGVQGPPQVSFSQSVEWSRY